MDAKQKAESKNNIDTHNEYLLFINEMKELELEELHKLRDYVEIL